MLEENETVRSHIPDLLYNLMLPHLETVDEVLSPGLTLLQWTSLNISDYIERVSTSLTEFDTLIFRARDILDMRIEGGLTKIAQATLCHLPESEPWTPQEFSDYTNVSYKHVYSS